MIGKERFGYNFHKFIACIVVTLAFLFSVFTSAPAHAQAVGATLSGTVTDATGGAIAGAEISIKNLGTDITRTLTSDSAGFYSAPNLSPGNYSVTTTAPGFESTKASITLSVGAQQQLNLPMKVGATTETVNVSESAPAVELTSATISSEVNSTTVRELPLNGRDWTQLATLEPGVSTVRTQASTSSATANRSNRGFGNQLTDSGHSPYENSYRVNGININDYTNGSPGSVIGANLGTDAIQEFSVLTTDYTAEYGRTSGAIINSITKSGENTIHGDLFGFVRNASLDAKNYFDSPTSPIPPFERYQYGGAIGGPIVKDKTFFFAAYEGVLQDRSTTFTDQVPSAAARAGTVCTANPSPAPPTCNNVGVSPAVQPYLAFWPTGNGPLSPDGNTQTYTYAGLFHLQESYASARVDHHFSDNDTLSGSWMFDSGPYTQPDPLGNVLTSLFSSREMFEAEETHIFSPTLVNTARFGYSRSHGISGETASAINPIAADTTLGVRPGIPAPILTVSGLTPTTSVGSTSENLLVSNSFQFYDDVFMTKGKHSLKFGFAVERIQFNASTLPRPDGNFTFSGLTAFLQDTPTSVQELSPSNSYEVGARQTVFGFYAQDTWQVRSNLTLNVGLRYEPTTLPTEANGRYQVLENLTNPTVTPVQTLWSQNQTLKNFEPRVGFSWDPFHSGKTAVRGGFGIFDVLPLPWTYTQTAAFEYPFAVQASAGGLSQGDFPVVQPPHTLNSTSNGAFYVPQNPPRSYAMNWNLNVQHEFTPTLSATVGYVGSRSVHLPELLDDVNYTLPTLTAAGYMWPATGGGKLNNNFGGIRAQLFDNDAWYDALQAGVTKKLGHGFQLQGSYTFSKCLDTGSNLSFNDPFQNSMPDYMYFDHALTKGMCDFNVTQSGVVSYIWTIPTPSSMKGLTEKLLGGWQAGGIITAQTGSPFTPVVGGDPLGRNAGDTSVDYVDRVPGCNPINGSVSSYLNLSCFTLPTAPASFASECNTFPNATTAAPAGQVYCANLLGNLGRNQIVGPGLVDVDFSLFKNIRISERITTQFRVEMFNVLNHPNFLVPVDNETLFNGGSLSGGLDGSTTGLSPSKIDTTSVDSREIQFGLKINF
jgi:outer membrane receptor protein involved in Fe transport